MRYKDVTKCYLKDCNSWTVMARAVHGSLPREATLGSSSSSYGFCQVGGCQMKVISLSLAEMTWLVPGTPRRCIPELRMRSNLAWKTLLVWGTSLCWCQHDASKKKWVTGALYSTWLHDYESSLEYLICWSSFRNTETQNDSVAERLLDCRYSCTNRIT